MSGAMWTVVQVAYSCAPVGVDAVGGAEQVLTRLDQALVAAGHRSIVIGCVGSRAAGELVTTARLGAPLDEVAVAAAREATARALAGVLARRQVDVVHLHGVDFAHVAPPAGVPTVVTLHLPLDWYPAAALARGDLHRVCVSAAQRRARPGLEAEVIDNGVDLDCFVARRRKRRFALVLSRICPEKGIHLAIDAARAAGVPLVIGGQLFPYPAHVDYFERAIRPRLGHGVTFAGPLGFLRKRRLLAAARCLVVPSHCAETSSLVAMEALASGTPVVAWRAGALPDLVEHGRTGFLVDDPHALARAIAAAGALDPAACRRAAERRFSAAAMVRRYLALYERLAARAPAEAAS